MYFIIKNVCYNLSDSLRDVAILNDGDTYCGHKLDINTQKKTVLVSWNKRESYSLILSQTWNYT